MTPLEINKRIAELKDLTYEPSARSNDVLVKLVPNHAGRWFNWAENIADAWELFEEMESPFFYKFPNLHALAAEGRYGCGNSEISPFRFGQTAPLAICKAWIAWKEAQ